MQAPQSMQSSGLTYSCGVSAKPASSCLGWMQSTGQACTHNSSLVQVSVITYAMKAGCAIPMPAPNGRKQEVKLNNDGWVGHSAQRGGLLAQASAIA